MAFKWPTSATTCTFGWRLYLWLSWSNLFLLKRWSKPISRVLRAYCHSVNGFECERSALFLCHEFGILVLILTQRWYWGYWESARLYETCKGLIYSCYLLLITNLVQLVLKCLQIFSVPRFEARSWSASRSSTRPESCPERSSGLIAATTSSESSSGSPRGSTGGDFRFYTTLDQSTYPRLKLGRFNQRPVF